MLAPVAAAVAAVAGASGSGVSGTDLLGLAVANGPIGILCLALLYGWKRERDRADAAQADKDKLVGTFIDRVVPALTESTSATRDLLAARRQG